MKRESIETPSFTKKWFALGFTDDDLAELQQFLLKNPEAGDIMVGTGGLKKIRFAFQGREAEVPKFAMLILQLLQKHT